MISERYAKLLRSQTYVGSHGEICSLSAQRSSLSGEYNPTVFGKKFSWDTQLHISAYADCECAQAQAQDNSEDLRQSQWSRSDDLNHRHNVSRSLLDFPPAWNRNRLTNTRR